MSKTLTSGTQKTALERYDSILPSINHKVNTVEFQYNLMVLNMRYTKYLNPSQTAVSCSDQPLYALKKVIQWSYPEIFLEKNLCIFRTSAHRASCTFGSWATHPRNSAGQYH